MIVDRCEWDGGSVVVSLEIVAMCRAGHPETAICHHQWRLQDYVWNCGACGVVGRPGLKSAEGEHIFRCLKEIDPLVPIDLGELSGGAVDGRAFVKVCELDGDANETKIVFVSTGRIKILKAATERMA